MNKKKKQKECTKCGVKLKDHMGVTCGYLKKINKQNKRGEKDMNKQIRYYIHEIVKLINRLGGYWIWNNGEESEVT